MSRDFLLIIVFDIVTVKMGVYRKWALFVFILKYPVHPRDTD
jgi:hypothetical protein